jgi:tripeptide aminopeptidase
LLKKEMEEIGLENIDLSEYGYLIGTLPANLPSRFPKDLKVPTIGFIAHVDTSPDSSGKNVNPIMHKNYGGGDIPLPGNKEIVLNYDNSPNLRKCMGLDIITADGTTLLGADDKAGVAEIMDAVALLRKHPEIRHGEIKICFTPDEEVGMGTKYFDIPKFGADFAYTVDGGELGEIENETFNADTFVVTFHGVSYHPGYAKGKLLNAVKMASEFIEMLPKKKFSPETTWKREGYVHPFDIQGGVEKVQVKILVRDFELKLMKDKEKTLQELCDRIQAKYPNGKVETQILEYYRNMRFKLEEDPRAVNYAIEAAKKSRIKPHLSIIRGGTDGANLSYKGLLTPNLFAGMQNFHGKYEWVPVQWMEKAVVLICNIAQIWLAKTAK